MNKYQILPLMMCALTTSAVISQTDASSTTKSSIFQDFESAVMIEPHLGVTSSFAYGDYIDYQRSFLDVEEEGTKFSGGIQPIVFGTLGLQVRVMPFKDNILKNLGFSAGIQYVQKGFASKFKLDYTSQSDFTDVTKYKEIYRHNYLSFPFQVRWGTKWFGTMGLSFSGHIRSTKTQKLTHEQSGGGAFEGGFDISESDKKKIDKDIMRKTSAAFILGGGHQFNDNWSVALRANFGGKIFKNVTDNYKTILLDLSFFKTI